MPTKIVDVTTAELTRATDAQTTAQGNLAAAQGLLVTAQANQAQAGALLQAVEAQIAAIRVELGASPMQADADALGAALEQAIVLQRTRQNDAVEAEANVDAAQRMLVAADADLKARTAAALAAKDADDAAKATQAEHDAWAAAVGAPPVSTLKADAQAAAGGPLHADADSKLKADVPDGLRQRALDRAKAERKRAADAAAAVASAQDELATVLAGAAYGDDGDALAAAIAYDRAEAALRDYVLGGRDRLDRAIALIAGVVASPSPTPAEVDRIHAAEFTTPAADNDPAVNFLKAEAARDAKRAALDNAQAALQTALLAAWAADPDDLNPTNAAITQAETDLGTAVTELGTAETAYTQALRTALRAWAATVPEQTWRALEDFEEADAILADLTATTASTLVTALRNAENAYATKLIDAAKAARARAFVARVVAERADGSRTADRAAEGRRFAALRGDR